jgi:hypothetical protein
MVVASAAEPVAGAEQIMAKASAAPRHALA